MSSRQLTHKFIMIMVGLIIALPVFADESEKPPAPKGKATEEFGCVAPVADMRRNHMEKILHQRDETVYEGIRTKQHSLAECVNCHITPKKDGTYANFGENQHFCSSCHNYTSVKVDCFECHRDKPENVDYKHSLLEKPNPHHNDFAFNQKDNLTKETLDVLSSGGKQ